MTYKFGDKIVWDGKPAVYLRGDVVMGGKDCWISACDGERAHELWVSLDDIAPQGVEASNLRDKMVFIDGQIGALLFHCTNHVFDSLESIDNQYQAVLKELFPDYK